MFQFEKFYRNWSLVQAIWCTFSIVLVLFFDLPYLVWLLGVGAMFFFYMKQIPHFLKLQSKKLNFANITTTIRLMLVLFVGFFHKNLPLPINGSILILAIALDGLDGYLARKLKTESKEGETYDMEVDAFLVCLLSCIHSQNPILGTPLVLVAGTMKYIYTIVITLWNNPKQKEILPKKLRSTIAVIFFIALLVPFFYQGYFIKEILVLPSVLILISFGGSLFGVYLKKTN